VRYARRDEEEEHVFRFALPANPLQAACEHFIAAVRGETDLEIPIEDGLRALEVCTAMVASAGGGGAAVSLE
jgi:predicted dehydrogenase